MGEVSVDWFVKSRKGDTRYHRAYKTTSGQ